MEYLPSESLFLTGVIDPKLGHLLPILTPNPDVVSILLILFICLFAETLENIYGSLNHLFSI